MDLTRNPLRDAAAILRVALLLAVSLDAACFYPAPDDPMPVSPSGFDASWSAAAGAFQDEGVRIAAEDRSAGVIRGTRDAIDVSGSVRTQAGDGVRVAFNTSGATGRDPGLGDRNARAYDRRTSH